MKKPDNFIAGLKKQEKYFAKLVSCKRKNGGGGGKRVLPEENAIALMISSFKSILNPVRLTSMWTKVNKINYNQNIFFLLSMNPLYCK